MGNVGVKPDTLADGAINEKTDTVITAADEIIFGDVTDSNNLKKDTVQGILDLAGGGFTLGTEQATTSGSTITFGSIPAGTKVIKLMFNGVSADAGVNLLCRIGDAGGIETSGYVGGSNLMIETGPAIAGGTDTVAFPIKGDNAANIHNGVLTWALLDSTNFDWVCSYAGQAEGNHVVCGGGTKSLSAELTQLDVTLPSGSFVAGSMNISYS